MIFLKKNCFETSIFLIISTIYLLVFRHTGCNFLKIKLNKIYKSGLQSSYSAFFFWWGGGTETRISVQIINHKTTLKIPICNCLFIWYIYIKKSFSIACLLYYEIYKSILHTLNTLSLFLWIKRKCRFQTMISTVNLTAQSRPALSHQLFCIVFITLLNRQNLLEKILEITGWKEDAQF